MEVLRDPQRNKLPIFASAEACLVTDHPERLMEVRNQEKTNSCTAHVVTAVTFGAQVRQKGQAVPGSPQEVVDYGGLFKRPKGEGPYKLDERMCYSYRTVFKYATEIGISPVKLYPWNGKCKFREWNGSAWDRVVECKGKVIEPSKKIFINGKENVPQDEIEKYLRHQPLTGQIHVTEELKTWNTDEIYRGGLTLSYTGEGEDVAKHAVTVVGFGGEGQDAYFVCQNSYGTGWRYRGYFKAARHLITNKYIPILLEETGGSSSLEGGNNLGKGTKDDPCGSNSEGGSSSLGKRKLDDI